MIYGEYTSAEFNVKWLPFSTLKYKNNLLSPPSFVFKVVFESLLFTLGIELLYYDYSVSITLMKNFHTK